MNQFVLVISVEVLFTLRYACYVTHIFQGFYVKNVFVWYKYLCTYLG